MSNSHDEGSILNPNVALIMEGMLTYTKNEKQYNLIKSHLDEEFPKHLEEVFAKKEISAIIPLVSLIEFEIKNEQFKTPNESSAKAKILLKRQTDIQTIMETSTVIGLTINEFLSVDAGAKGPAARRILRWLGNNYFDEGNVVVEFYKCVLIRFLKADILPYKKGDI